MVDRACRALPDGLHSCGRVAVEVVGGVVPLCAAHAEAVRVDAVGQSVKSAKRAVKAAR